MTVKIYRGLPGSGKSTEAREELRLQRSFKKRIIFSADQFMVDGQGIYTFDPKRLHECHSKCLKSFVDAVQESPKENLLLVDNTNITVAEVAPYAALALTYGHELDVVTIMANAALCARRNTHGVPLDTILRMENLMKEQVFPVRWAHFYKQSEFREEA